MTNAQDSSSWCRPYFSCDVLGACVFTVVGGSLCVDGLVGSVMMGESEVVCVGSISFLVGCSVISLVCFGVDEICGISKSMCSKCSSRF